MFVSDEDCRYRSYPVSSLVLFAESLGVCFAVGIEEFLTALLPGGFKFSTRDVPIRPAFSGNGPKVLPQIFKSWAAEEPIAVIEFVDDQSGLEDDHVRNHRIV